MIWAGAGVQLSDDSAHVLEGQHDDVNEWGFWERG